MRPFLQAQCVTRNYFLNGFTILVTRNFNFLCFQYCLREQALPQL